MRELLSEVIRNSDIIPFGDKEEITRKILFVKKVKDPFYENLPQDLFLIKEISPNILTQEASEFVSNLKNLFKEYFAMIDSQSLKIDYTKFHFGILK